MYNTQSDSTSQCMRAVQAMRRKSEEKKTSHCQVLQHVMMQSGSVLQATYYDRSSSSSISGNGLR